MRLRPRKLAKTAAVSRQMFWQTLVNWYSNVRQPPAAGSSSGATRQSTDIGI